MQRLLTFNFLCMIPVALCLFNAAAHAKPIVSAHTPHFLKNSSQPQYPKPLAIAILNQKQQNHNTIQSKIR